MRLSTLTLNVSAPLSVLPSASTGGTSIVALSPAPAVVMSLDGALVATLGFAIPCTATSSAAQLVGNLASTFFLARGALTA